MRKRVRKFFRWLFGSRPGRVGRFRYRDYRPAEARILREFDEQLAVPGHDPSTLYLHPRDHRLFRRAARRAAAYAKGDDITEEGYRGKQVVMVPWGEIDAAA